MKRNEIIEAYDNYILYEAKQKEDEIKIGKKIFNKDYDDLQNIFQELGKNISSIKYKNNSTNYIVKCREVVDLTPYQYGEKIEQYKSELKKTGSKDKCKLFRKTYAELRDSIKKEGITLELLKTQEAKNIFQNNEWNKDALCNILKLDDNTDILFLMIHCSKNYNEFKEFVRDVLSFEEWKTIFKEIGKMLMI